MNRHTLKAIEPAFCRYAVTDITRARKFYKCEPGLKPAPVCRMPMIFDPDGNTICIHKRNPCR